MFEQVVSGLIIAGAGGLAVLAYHQPRQYGRLYRVVGWLFAVAAFTIAVWTEPFRPYLRNMLGGFVLIAGYMAILAVLPKILGPKDDERGG